MRELAGAAAVAAAVLSGASGATLANTGDDESWWTRKAWRGQVGFGTTSDPVLSAAATGGLEWGAIGPVTNGVLVSASLRSHFVQGTTDNVLVRGAEAGLIGAFHWRSVRALRLHADAGPAVVSHQARSATGTGSLSCFALALGGGAAYVFGRADGQAIGIDYTR